MHHGLKMATPRPLGTLDIDPDIRPYKPGSRDLGSCVGVFCKNIVLKDRRGQFYLVTFQEDKVLDLKKLKKDLRAHRNFSFASNEELFSLLAVETGAVSPFGLMYDVGEKVKFVLDDDLMECSELLNFHPFEANETCLLSVYELRKFCKHLNKQIVTVKC